MSKKRFRREKRRIAEMNVVPYIDVMLVLLIIFMITSPLLTEGVNVNLPPGSKGTTQLSAGEGELIVISIDKEGKLHLGDKQYSSSKELITKVKVLISTVAGENNSKVYVKGDKDVPYRKVVEMIASLKEAGVKEVGLVTKAKE